MSNVTIFTDISVALRYVLHDIFRITTSHTRNIKIPTEYDNLFLKFYRRMISEKKLGTLNRVP
jgi:hypothetical protein